MTRLALLLAALLGALLLAAPLRAQDDDKTFVETWLEKNLSAAGRDVQVTGFSGALAARATMQRLTIADDEGIWLTMTGAELDWTRSALLTGRLEIDAISAEVIEIARRPVAISDGPAAEASFEGLPELPVSIAIGRIEARRLVLGAPVLGVAAELALDGSGRLADGEGEARLALTRIDGAEGAFTIAAAYSNATRQLALDLDLTEGAGGIAATLTGLPGAPPVALSLSGSGPLDAFAADLALATDGAERLAGRLTLARARPGDAAAPLGFQADLAGDPRPLLAPDYREFFGRDVRLVLDGTRRPDGRLDIARFDISTDALRLAGEAVLAAGGWPERVALSGLVAAPDDEPVLLPVAGARTWLQRAEIAFDYDAAEGEGWRGRVALSGLSRPGLRLASAVLDGAGALGQGRDGAPPAFSGRLALAAEGLTGEDPAAPSLLGPTLSGRLDFSRVDGAPLRFTDISLDGTDYGLAGALSLATDWASLDLVAEGRVELAARDLARFAPATGQDLQGAARLTLEGRAAVPDGPFDVAIEGRGQDLALGVPELDGLFAGESTLAIRAARDASGTRLERLALAAPGATAEANGSVTSAGARLEAALMVPDAGRLVPGLAGAIALTLDAGSEAGAWAFTLDADAPGEARARVSGTAQTGYRGLGEIAAEASATLPRLAAYSGLAGRPLAGELSLSLSGTLDARSRAFALEGAARGAGLGLGLGPLDRLVAGSSRAGFALRRDAAGTLYLDAFDLATPELTASALGRVEAGVPVIEAEARLRDLARLVPGLPGALSGKGRASLGTEGWQVSGSATGPGGSTLTASGRIAADGGRAALSLTGRLPLELANGFIAPQALSGMAGFDLSLNGPFALGALSGTITAEGARAALPNLRLALDPLSAALRLSGGRASLQASAAVSTGGRIMLSGPVALTPPFAGDLALELAAVGLSDPNLYDLDASGRLTVSGPLAGGALVAGSLRLSDVELRIPETGFGVDGSLDGLRHLHEPASVRTTRARAGMLGAGGAGGGGAVYGLDLTVEAPNAVFLRGRGLDAELGGRVRLGGTTAAVEAQGGFSLIRGRLDLLGNRLVLTEGNASLRGGLDPAVRLVAETRADDVLVRIVLDGSAANPQVSFTSSPALPEDEILARLIFGRGLDEISAFQALKLASAVATLAGQGGAGTIGRLREGFGLADLDVAQDETGGLAVTVGTYISENVYTDVTVGADGRAEVSLNLQITPSLTGKGTVSSDGGTGLGIFFEKDY